LPVPFSSIKQVTSGSNLRTSRWRKLLFALETAETLEQLGRFPGWKLHPLKGNLEGLWSLTVTGNWRLIFRYNENMNSASDIDLIDYH